MTYITEGATDMGITVTIKMFEKYVWKLFSFLCGGGIGDVKGIKNIKNPKLL